MVTVSAEESPAPAVGNVAVDDIHLRRDQEQGEHAACSEYHDFGFTQAIICAIASKRKILYGLAAGEIIRPIADPQSVVFAIVQTALESMLPAIGQKPRKLILSYLDLVEPSGDKFIEIALFVHAKHTLLIDPERKFHNVATGISFFKMQYKGHITAVRILFIPFDGGGHGIMIHGEMFVGHADLHPFQKFRRIQSFPYKIVYNIQTAVALGLHGDVVLVDHILGFRTECEGENHQTNLKGHGENQQNCIAHREGAVCLDVLIFVFGPFAHLVQPPFPVRKGHCSAASSVMTRRDLDFGWFQMSLNGSVRILPRAASAPSQL